MKRLLLLVALLSLSLAPVARPRVASAKGGPAPDTVRISGGGLPHAVTVPVEDYVLATFGGWSADQAPAIAGPEAVHYTLDYVAKDQPEPVFSAQYVQGARGLYFDGGAWMYVSPRFQAMLDRYIAVGRADMVGETPTFAEALRAESSLSEPQVVEWGGEGRKVPAGRLVEALGRSQAVVFGMRGTLLGQRAANSPHVAVRFADGDEVAFIYAPPGAFAPYGLIFPDSAFFPSWSYSTLASPPAYWNTALAVPPEFDELMREGGVEPLSLDGVEDWRTVPLADARQYSGGIERVVVRDGFGIERDVPDDLVLVFNSPAALGPAPEPPFTGAKLTIEAWPEPQDPFPELRRPAVYDYHPCDATGCANGVLVQTQGMAVGNGGGGEQPPFYASAAIDEAVHAALAQPAIRAPGRGGGASAVARAAAVGVALPALPFGLTSFAQRRQRDVLQPMRGRSPAARA